jgi:hypothetical protein
LTVSWWLDRGIPVRGGPRRVVLTASGHQRPESDRVPCCPRAARAQVDSWATSEEARSIPHGATWSRSWPAGAEARRGISEETGCGDGYAIRPRSARVWLEFEPLRGAGLSGCATVSRQRLVRVGALRDDPQGAKRSALAGPAGVSGVTAQAGRVRDGPRGRGVRRIEAPVILWFQRRRVGVPLA